MIKINFAIISPGAPPRLLGDLVAIGLDRVSGSTLPTGYPEGRGAGRGWTPFTVLRGSLRKIEEIMKTKFS
jgi:hypothetical protein